MATGRKHLRALVSGLTLGAATQLAYTAQQPTPQAGSTNGDVPARLESFLGDDLVQDASAMIAVETYRDISQDSEKRIQERFDQLERMLSTRMEPFPGIQKISWQDGVGHRVFGFRLGSGSRRLALICHLDTVPPGDAEWGPFNARVEQRDLQGEVQPFLVGRGAIDDKGPAAAALAVLKALATQGPDLGDSTVEVLFDTSEEVGNLSIPYYFAAHGAPEFGIVFDAEWAVRAEKGIARPAFELPLSTSKPDTIHITELSTPQGPVNQIARSAQLRLGGGTAEQRDKLAGRLVEDYDAYGFDDPAYRAAPATVEITPEAVILRTSVVGAQHGSVPHLNRRYGANPLVSLLVFGAHLADTGVVAENHWSDMARFASFAFGTNVFGENHPDLLQAHDEVFVQGNGTTYAVTRLGPTDEADGGGVLRLAVDVRYATAHHATPWNRQPGLMPGPSRFPEVFDSLMSAYRQASDRGDDLVFSLDGHIGPDIRDPKSAPFVRLAKAFEAVTGEPMPLVAIGGGTDAKGNLGLIAAGPTFFDPEGSVMGPPVNYHGENEGAPLRSLRVSARILFQLAQNFIADARAAPATPPVDAIAPRTEHTPERPVPYDDFDAAQLDPDKWAGGEFSVASPSANTESIRQIQDDRLRLMLRSYGKTDSDSGWPFSGLKLTFRNSAAVTAIQATVQITDVAATGCPGNRAPTLTRATLGGHFFRAAPESPGSGKTDVVATIRLFRRSDFTDPPDVLRVGSIIYHCANQSCTSGSVLYFRVLGTVTRGQKARLRVRWDRENHQFIFQHDDAPEVVAPYTLSDSAPPLVQEKWLNILNSVPNCTATPRPVAFMEAWFDDVMVNESAAVDAVR